MILLKDLRDFGILPDIIRQYYILTLKSSISTLMNNSPENIERVLEENNIPSLNYLYNSIIISNDSLVVPEHTNCCLVLRYLEFGGEDMKPTHILQKTSRRTRLLFKGG